MPRCAIMIIGSEVIKMRQSLIEKYRKRSIAKRLIDLHVDPCSEIYQFVLNEILFQIRVDPNLDWEAALPNYITASRFLFDDSFELIPSKAKRS
jgi:hypothetical protein